MKQRLVIRLTAILAVTTLITVMAPDILAEESGFSLTIMAGKGRSKTVWDEPNLVPVQGTTVNGRGEVKDIVRDDVRGVVE